MNPADRWRTTGSRLGTELPVPVLTGLLAAYAEPHRAYHTLRHLAECFDHLDGSPRSPEDPAALELALWFHDAIYDTRRNDNEARSAEWARRALGDLSPDRLDRIESLVLVTRHAAAPATTDQALLLDVDLSILGASTARFDEYEAQVRVEYEWVPDQAYRSARGRILRGFLDRPALFHTPHFEALFEARARANLARSIARLEESEKST